MKGDRRKMSIPEQIAQLKSQGIRFNIVGEPEAIEFLTDHTYYFRLKFYAENYDKYQPNMRKSGQYINLEFAYLKELALLDLYLRRTLFAMVMDVEHYVKIQLLRDVNENPKEDGYSIVDEFFQRFRWLERDLSRQRGLYAGGLIQKYKGNFAVWNVVEVITFSQLISLYELYHEKYGFDGKEDLAPFFWAVKTLRNSIAHNNSLLNNLRTVDNTIYPVNKDVARLLESIGGIGSTMARKKVSIPFLSDFTATIHAFNCIVTSKDEREMRMSELEGLLDGRFRRHQDYFKENQVISSAFEFINLVVKHYR